MCEVRVDPDVLRPQRAPQQAVAPRCCGVPRARARGVLARWRRDARRRRAEKRLCEEGGLRVGCAGATGAASGAPAAPAVAMMAQGVPLRGPLAEPATQGATVRGAPVADAVPALGMPVSGSSRGGGGGFRDTDVAVTVAAGTCAGAGGARCADAHARVDGRERCCAERVAFDLDPVCARPLCTAPRPAAPRWLTCAPPSRAPSLSLALSLARARARSRARTRRMRPSS